MLVKKIGIGFVLCLCLVGCKKKQQTQNNQAVQSAVPTIPTVINLSPPTGLTASVGMPPYQICAMTPGTLAPLPACGPINPVTNLPPITPCSMGTNQFMIASCPAPPGQCASQSIQFGILINNVCTVVNQNGPVGSAKPKIK